MEDFSRFIDGFKVLSPEERHYRALWREGRLPPYPESLGGGGLVALGNELFPPGREVVLRRHTRFLPEYPHCHAFLEVEALVAGSCVQTVGGRRVPMRAGDVVLIAPGTYHAVGVFDESSVLLNVLVKQDVVGTALAFGAREGGPLAPFVASLRQGAQDQGAVLLPHAEDSFGDLADLWEERDGVRQVLRFSLWCVSLFRNPSPRMLVKGDAGSRRLGEILTLVRERPGSVSLAQLADRYGLTPSYLSGLIHRRTGLSFSRLVAESRMEKACALLSAGEAGNKEVAAALGLETARFCRFFRQWSGTSPQAWRKAHVGKPA